MSNNPLLPDRLKPCPFCGAEGGLSVSTWDVQPDNWWSGHVRCTDCDAQGASPGEWLDSEPEAEAAAIEAWNRRAEALSPPREGAREAVARIIMGPKSFWNYGDTRAWKLAEWRMYPDVERALIKADRILTLLSASSEGEG